MTKISTWIAALVLPTLAYSQSTITLRRSFIDSFMNRVTITANYDVWYTHHRAKPETEDGDIHCSGYDKKIGLATVAEIMNAKDEQDAIDVLIDHEGKGKANNPKISMTGVWRLWPEHMGSGTTFKQGMKFTKSKIQAKTTNPDHVFEIHPVTELEGSDLTHTLRRIGPDYEMKKWEVSYPKFRAKAFSISSNTKFISFTTKQIGENYIDMWIRIDTLWEVEDGAFAYCTTMTSDFDPDEDEIADKQVTGKTRVVLVKNSEVYNAVINGDLGMKVHIVGTPRINLAIISWREWVMDDRPEVKTWRLPFEIIAAGLL